MVVANSTAKSVNKNTSVTQAKKQTANKGAKTPERKKTLIIVESPSKGKVISKYLGSSYKVVASVGHVRDLPKSKLGVDIENDFEPYYINIRGKGDVIKELKKEAKEAKKVLLATDPDREGEAISWHLAYILGMDPASECRIEFHEINKKAVTEAIKHPRPIDMGLVDAQQARRVLDRLVGYQISPLLWKKISSGLSAGRVQSAALKMICDRENEIQRFVPVEYWAISVKFKEGFEAKLDKINNKKIYTEEGSNGISIKCEEDAQAIENDLKRGDYIVDSVRNSQRKVKPYAPFTTSSLQQDASIKLSFQTSKTMQIAQQLYEGVKIKGHGERGLVTYIRTDSVRISSEALNMAKGYIRDAYGEKYVGNNFFSNKNKDIQDAHEAIRPSDVTIEPDAIKDSLTSDQYKLYKLIWERFVASQMAAAVYDTSSAVINNEKYSFRAAGSILVFDGWKRVYSSGKSEENMIPELEEGQKLLFKSLKKEQKFTQPPSRYTEAGLVKVMEENNIGRPSTYATIISTLQKQKYVKKEKKNFVPTKLGFDVTGILSEYFSDIVSVEFTADMENRLDEVELQHTGWRTVVADFYSGFSEELAVAEKEVQKIEQEVILSDEVCPVCGKPMAIKESRYGKFLACSGYPECNYTKSIVKSTGVKCPVCGKDIVERRGRKSGKIFYGCSGFPDCNVSYWDKPTGRFCPECGSMLLQSKSKTIKCKCSNSDCKYQEKK